MPNGINAPRFLHLYIYDTANEVDNRLGHFQNDRRNVLGRDIVEGLIDFLDHNNALIRLFKTARDVKTLSQNLTFLLQS